MDYFVRHSTGVNGKYIKGVGVGVGQIKVPVSWGNLFPDERDFMMMWGKTETLPQICYVGKKGIE